MVWLGRFSLFSYPGEDGNVHGGKKTQELASRRVATYSDSPVKFSALGAFRPQALVPVCTQEAALPMGYALLPLLNMIYLAPMSPSPFAPPPGIVEQSSHHYAEPRPHRAEHTLRSRAPRSDPSCRFVSTTRALQNRAPFRKDDP